MSVHAYDCWVCKDITAIKEEETRVDQEKTLSSKVEIVQDMKL